jgi:hypothetical protein
VISFRSSLLLPENNSSFGYSRLIADTIVFEFSLPKTDRAGAGRCVSGSLKTIISGAPETATDTIFFSS